MNKFVLITVLGYYLMITRVNGQSEGGDPCSPSPCGKQAECQLKSDLLVCSCTIGTTGNPFTECTKIVDETDVVVTEATVSASTSTSTSTTLSPSTEKAIPTSTSLSPTTERPTSISTTERASVSTSSTTTTTTTEKPTTTTTAKPSTTTTASTTTSPTTSTTTTTTRTTTTTASPTVVTRRPQEQTSTSSSASYSQSSYTEIQQKSKPNTNPTMFMLMPTSNPTQPHNQNFATSFNVRTDSDTITKNYNNRIPGNNGHENMHENTRLHTELSSSSTPPSTSTIYHNPYQNSPIQSQTESYSSDIHHRVNSHTTNVMSIMKDEQHRTHITHTSHPLSNSNSNMNKMTDSPIHYTAPITQTYNQYSQSYPQTTDRYSTNYQTHQHSQSHPQAVDRYSNQNQKPQYPQSNPQTTDKYTSQNQNSPHSQSHPQATDRYSNHNQNPQYPQSNPQTTDKYSNQNQNPQYPQSNPQTTNKYTSQNQNSPHSQSHPQATDRYANQNQNQHRNNYNSDINNNQYQSRDDFYASKNNNQNRYQENPVINTRYPETNVYNTQPISSYQNTHRENEYHSPPQTLQSGFGKFPNEQFESLYPLTQDPYGRYTNCRTVNNILACADYSDDTGTNHNAGQGNFGSNNQVRHSSSVLESASPSLQQHPLNLFDRTATSAMNNNQIQNRPSSFEHRTVISDHQPSKETPTSPSSDPKPKLTNSSDSDDLCKKFCGIDSMCRVLMGRPICGCPASHTGNPAVRCTPIGKENENQCQRHKDCKETEVCMQSVCVDPCTASRRINNQDLLRHSSTVEKQSMCGNNAKCHVIEHTPLCRCMDGFYGNAYVGCVA